MPGDPERTDWIFSVNFSEMCSRCLLKENKGKPDFKSVYRIL